MNLIWQPEFWRQSMLNAGCRFVRPLLPEIQTASVLKHCQSTVFALSCLLKKMGRAKQFLFGAELIKQISYLDGNLVRFLSVIFKNDMTFRHCH